LTDTKARRFADGREDLDGKEQTKLISLATEVLLELQQDIDESIKSISSVQKRKPTPTLLLARWEEMASFVARALSKVDKLPTSSARKRMRIS
jgi:hypothetical protein